MLHLYLDRIFITIGSKYRGAVFACQGILGFEKQGLAMRLGREGGAAAPPFRDQLTTTRKNFFG
jgi:hypothetical protein